MDKHWFLNSQWAFSTVIFKDNQFHFKISKNCPLPYIPLERPTSEEDNGNFGEVHKVGLLMKHLDTERPPRYLSSVRSNNPSFRIFVKMSKVIKTYPSDQNSNKCRDYYVHEVAVKKLRTDGLDDKAIKGYFEKEKNALLAMRKFHHKDLIEALAVYEKGTQYTDKYFVFPWATGGNLHSLWRDEPHSKGGRAYISWALHQMTGLADGLAKLHEENIRHEDIKPQNILLFSSDGDDMEEPVMGTLVLADVGISKAHGKNTWERQNLNKPTTNKASTIRYESPEMEKRKGKVFPRKIDVWSTGCVLLELVIWLLCGSQGQLAFDDELLDTDSNQGRFWNAKEKYQYIHPVVKSWIDTLRRSAGSPSALGDLLGLVEDQLPTVDVDMRADSRKMHEELLKIVNKCCCPDDPQYLLERTRTIQIDTRERTSEETSQNVFPNSQQVSTRCS